jgi:hypothetical protein
MTGNMIYLTIAGELISFLTQFTIFPSLSYLAKARRKVSFLTFLPKTHRYTLCSPWKKPITSELEKQKPR